VKTDVIKKFVFALLMFGACLPAARAQKGLGRGIILGYTTGVSVKKWLGKRRAIDGAAEWASSDNNYFQMHADYLIHDFSALQATEIQGRLPVYYGIGGASSSTTTRNAITTSLLVPVCRSASPI